MGKVYCATDVSLNRTVAVKMIRDEFFANQSAMEKFRQESRVTASLAHPNVVTVHDFGVDANQRVFLVMELLEGITLREELRQKSRLTAERTLELFEGICAGIGAAHSRGLVHRDLKPENIFWDRIYKIVKITDFEIAKVLDEISNDANATATGVLVGTIRYMSPSDFKAKSVLPRSGHLGIGCNCVQIVVRYGAVSEERTTRRCAALSWERHFQRLRCWFRKLPIHGTSFSDVLLRLSGADGLKVWKSFGRD